MRKLLRNANNLNTNVMLYREHGAKPNLRIDYTDVRDFESRAAAKFCSLRAPVDVDLPSFCRRAQRMFRAVMDGRDGWNAVSYHAKWDCLVDYVNTKLLPAMEQVAGHSPAPQLDNLLGNTARGELSTAWQFGRGQRPGLKDATRRIRARARAKITETPGSLQPSARASRYGLLCRRSNGCPSSHSLFPKNPSKRLLHRRLRHGRARLSDTDMSPGGLCHAHRAESLWNLGPRLYVQESMRQWPDYARATSNAQELLNTSLPMPAGARLPR